MNESDITLLNEFAKVALQSFLVAYPDHFRNGTEGADYCYKVAGEMLKAKKRLLEKESNP